MNTHPAPNEDPRARGHLLPVWITLGLLLVTITATVFYFNKIDTTGFLPGKVLVLTLLELNLILVVLLVLLLSRNLIKHFFFAAGCDITAGKLRSV